MVAQHVSESMIYDDDEGGDVILDSFHLHSISQLPKNSPNCAAKAAVPFGAALSAAGSTSGRRVYSKQFLLSNLAMGSEFEGPLTVVPRTLSEQKKSKLSQGWQKYFTMVVDRIRNLVRQNSRNEYFTPEQLAQVYKNVYGERIPAFDELSNTKTKDAGIPAKTAIVYFFVPDITIEFYPITEVIKIFWNSQGCSLTGTDE